MVIDLDKLEKKIDQLKQQLAHTVNSTGINSSESLKCSQELDQHIIVYQKYRLKQYVQQEC